MKKLMSNLFNALSTPKNNTPIQINQHIETPYLNYFYGGSQLTSKHLSTFQQIATNEKIIQQYEDILNEKIMNQNEQRKVRHHHTRLPNQQNIYTKEQQNILQFSNNIHNNTYVGFTKKQFKHVVQIGIGGSHLGPKTLYDFCHAYAIENNKQQQLTASFISHLDPLECKTKLNQINPETTLFIIASKSGSTQETHSNLTLLTDWWLAKGLNKTDLAQHCITISCKASSLDNKTIASNRFYIDEHIGGRFSATSAIGGVLISLCFGPKIFEQILQGAHNIDNISKNHLITENPALFAAILDCYHTNQRLYPAKALIAYSYALRTLPQHITQLDCESNGKQTTKNNEAITYTTSIPILTGTANAQHSFFQMLHQGNQTIPVEFLAVNQTILPTKNEQEAHKKQNTNLIAQLKAFQEGHQSHNQNQHCPGNKPVTIINIPSLNPENIGALISFYENKIMFQGFLWKLNSFDQEGVELGKAISQDILTNPQNHTDLLTILK